MDQVNADRELVPTRQSLLERLKNWDDQESWRSFMERYWALIYRTALKAGLSDAEAQDVVQETVIAVSKKIPEFEYQQGGSFKKWLLQLTSWRIKDHLRKRDRGLDLRKPKAANSTETATVERVPDPAGGLEATWDQEWEANLVATAIDRVKRKVDSKQYQIFDLHVLKQWPVTRVTKTLRVNAGRVYLAKHRVSKLLTKEIDFLREKPI